MCGGFAKPAVTPGLTWGPIFPLNCRDDRRLGLYHHRYGTLYTGVTADIWRRAWEYRDGVVPGFSKRYGLKHLVYVEAHDDIRDAILREKQLKRWLRPWKIELIQSANPTWVDLYEILI